MNGLSGRGRLRLECDDLPTSQDLEVRVRTAAFAFLEGLRFAHDDVFPRQLLEHGFDFEGQRVPLIGPQGIFKPAILSVPISITTAPPSDRKEAPYTDEVGADGLLSYKYRGSDPNHRDNVGLRDAMQRQLPLVYFYGILPGRYIAAWPSYIVGDNPGRLTFSVSVDDRLKIKVPSQGVAEPVAPIEDVRRAYVTAAVQRRLHQVAFRERVIDAYRTHCAVCRLRHRELLEAAHILPDKHPSGLPIVSNGLALCKLHHAAFDTHILGIRPDYSIEIRLDVLQEKDGPMLQHGLQGFNGKTLTVPTTIALQPRRDFLEERYSLFKKAV